jgi:hypothetical protein
LAGRGNDQAFFKKIAQDFFQGFGHGSRRLPKAHGHDALKLGKFVGLPSHKKCISMALQKARDKAVRGKLFQDLLGQEKKLAPQFLVCHALHFYPRGPMEARERMAEVDRLLANFWESPSGRGIPIPWNF